MDSEHAAEAALRCCTDTKWRAYLQQRSTLVTSPLSEEIHAALGPVIYLTTGLSAGIPNMDIEPSPAVRKDGDGTQTLGTHMALQWTALLLSPSPIPSDGAGTPQGSQQVALQAARMVAVLEAAEVTLCTHSRVVFKGLTGWLPPGLQMSGCLHSDCCGIRNYGRTCGQQYS